MMNLSFVIIGIISGLILTFWIGAIWHKSYNNLMRNHWTVYHIKQMMQIRQMQTKLTANQTSPVHSLQSACSRKYRTRSSPDTTMLS